MSIEDEIKSALAAEGIDASDAVNKAQETETQAKESTHSEEKQYTSFEQEQIEKGWNPEGVKSAEEWSRSEPLYEEIKARGKEIKRMQKALDALTEHMTKQEKIAYDKALKTLSQEKEDAILRGDVKAVQQIEQQHIELTTPKEIKKIPEADEFTERYEHILNSANFEEMEIAAFVYSRDKELMDRKLSPAEHMKTLESHMLKKFPSYFNKGKEEEVVDRARSRTVETGEGSNVSRVSGKKKFNFHDLSPEQKQVARDFEKFGVMKIDKYIEQLIELKELQ